MDYTLVIGLLVVLVVGFFAYQWMVKRPVARPPSRPLMPSAAAGGTGESAATMSSAPPKEEKFPVITGQTKAETLTKEPDQRREPSSNQQPVLHDGQAPAQFDQHLRHPEQLFHQPNANASPSLEVVDVPSGRAAVAATPLGPVPVGAGQQGFNPEMAQNGGAFLGNSVFAFDGMEPTGFTSF